jgi:hypothetical protein
MGHKHEEKTTRFSKSKSHRFYFPFCVLSFLNNFKEVLSMLESEAFKGQLIKVTSGTYKGKRGIIRAKGVYDANVQLEDTDPEKPFISGFLAYEKLESLDANVDACCDSKDASVPNTKYYDEHYASMVGLEPIELMQLVLSPAEFIGFLKGNIIKYSMRAGKKQGEAAEKDIAKAKRYAQWLRKVNPFDTQFLINPKED